MDDTTVATIDMGRKEAVAVPLSWGSWVPT